MLKFLNIICGIIAIIIGLFFRRLYFLIPMLYSGPISTPVPAQNIFYYPYPIIIYFARYSITLFYIFLGLTVIYSTFNYRHSILKIMIILLALIGIYSSFFYFYNFITVGLFHPWITVPQFMRYDKLAGFIYSIFPSIVPYKFPNTCVTIAQLLLVLSIIIIAVLKILNRPKTIIKRNILAGLIAFIVLAFQVFSRLYVLVNTPSSVPYYFSSLMMPKDLIIPYLLSSLSCICVAYCIYRILATPNKLKASNIH